MQQNISSPPIYSEFVGPEIPNSTRAVRFYDPSPQFSYNADGLSNGPAPGITTVQSVYLYARDTWGDRNYLGTLVNDHYEFVTYQESIQRAFAFGSGLQKLNLLYEDSDIGYNFKLIGIYLKNCANWIIADIANSLYCYCSVSIYDALGPEAIQFVLQQTNLTTLIVSDQNAYRIIEDKVNVQNLIIASGEITQELQDKAQKAQINLYSFDQIVSEGEQSLLEIVLADDNTPFTLCYTSGTTGMPKGAIITQNSITSAIPGVYLALLNDKQDLSLSYLPLAHVYERLMSIAFAYLGNAIAFYRGDILRLMEDIQIAKPTVLIGVPRILNRLYDGITSKFAALPPQYQETLSKAKAEKLQNLQKGIYTHPEYDQMFFNQCKALLGGNIRLITSGSAPIKPETLELLRIYFCCNIIEGYGQTELSAGCVAGRIEDPSVGHLGGPTPCMEIRIEDIPEMDYRVTDVNEEGQNVPRGEICFRGPCLFKGYYKNPQLTAEAIDSDGWLHSGDIVELLPNLVIRIIDRKKNIFKLAQAEYVAPEKLENIYQTSQYVAMIFVEGNSLQHYLVAIIVPEIPVLQQWIQSNNSELTLEQAIENSELKQQVIDSLAQIAREAKLQPFEYIRKVKLVLDPFNIESGVLTPTFKLNRANARKAFENAIDELYLEPL